MGAVPSLGPLLSQARDGLSSSARFVNNTFCRLVPWASSATKSSPTATQPDGVDQHPPQRATDPTEATDDTDESTNMENRRRPPPVAIPTARSWRSGGQQSAVTPTTPPKPNSPGTPSRSGTPSVAPLTESLRRLILDDINCPLKGPISVPEGDEDNPDIETHQKFMNLALEMVSFPRYPSASKPFHTGTSHHLSCSISSTCFTPSLGAASPPC
jgi:hypothetical protein